MKQPKQKLFRRILGILALILAGVLLFSCLIVPAFHRQVSPREMEALSPAPADLGDANERVLCLDDNRDALLWRLRVIRQAREELIFATYSFLDDQAGRHIITALADAAQRGVRVQILVDGFNGGVGRSSAFRQLAAMPGVAVKFYNPINPLKPWRLNYRMHDKYLIADRQVYILGGRNTKNLSLGDYPGKKDFDRDVLVYCPKEDERNSLNQVREYFASVWALKAAKPFPGKTTPEGRQALEDNYRLLDLEYPREPEPDWAAITLPTRGICLLHNPPEPKNKAPLVWEGLMQLMAQGNEALIQTPYLICGGKMYRDLDALTDGGTRTRILLNSVESGANPWGSTDYLNQKYRIRRTGAELYEYMGSRSCHAKTLVIDDRISVVGSFNFDMRSAYLDTEMMLVIDSPELNAHLRQYIRGYMERSRYVLPDGTQGEGPEFALQKMPVAKQIVYLLLRLLTPIGRHLL